MIVFYGSRGHEGYSSLGKGARNGRGVGGSGRSFIVFVFFFLRTLFSHRSIPIKGKSSKNPKNLQILTLGYPLVLMIIWRAPACASWNNLSKTDEKEKTEWSFNPFTLKNDQQWWGIEHPPAKTVWFNTRLFELKFKETGIVNEEEKMILRSWEWRG